jgi:bifunctional polynucleotide phosphatase/kinase
MQQVHHDVMRSRAYNTVGDIIADWRTVITSSKDLKGTKGVGKSSVAKIDEFLQTGKITALEELQEMAGSKAPTAPLSKDAEMAFQFI